MNEKGQTPSELSIAGYHQALDNFVYHINRLANEIDASTAGEYSADTSAELVGKAIDLIGGGKIFEEFRQPIETLDEAFALIVKTYGYSEQQVEKDLQDHFDAHLGDFMIGAFFGE